jgi:glycosyltransferase involved in cell wall biosynthesis
LILPALNVSSESAEVSVVIPCFNQGRYLGLAIESVLRQTHPPFELIVVDDGSNDDTTEVANRYRNSQVCCISQQNQGPAAARNAGLALCRANFVLFLDADDLLLPTALELGVAHLLRRPDCAFVYGHHRFINADGRVTKEFQPQNFEGCYYKGLLHHNFIGMPGTVLYRRNILNQIGGFDPGDQVKGCEDYEIYLRIARQFPICSYDTVIAEYRQHDTSLSRNKNRILRAALTVLSAQEPFIKVNQEYQAMHKAGLQFHREYYKDPTDNSSVLPESSEVADQLPDQTTPFADTADKELLREQLFARGSRGSQIASWINRDELYQFCLFPATDRQQMLASVWVRREEAKFLAPTLKSESRVPFITAAPNPVPAGTSSSTISWSTGSGETGEVYTRFWRVREPLVTI